MYKIILLGALFCSLVFAENRRSILITGYWPPTNEMVKEFCTDPTLNPQGWKGKNWKNLGYDVHSFFPTFPNGLGKGEGILEVDYQDTSRDFWDIVERVKPIAIVSFGLGKGPWEIEMNARNLPGTLWRKDYQDPKQPFTKPDKNKKDGFVLHATLPTKEIAQAINSAQLGVNAWVDTEGNPGAFLCEYMAYHVMWYQSIHKKDEKFPCMAAGFIHVGSAVKDSQAKLALDITLQKTIELIKLKKDPVISLGKAKKRE